MNKQILEPKTNSELCREWYQRNRKRKLNYQKKYNLKTNYASEKSDKQKRIRNIKRHTRNKYPLLNKLFCLFCYRCGEVATEHHHNTKPIEIDKFFFVCHKCHVMIHRLKGGEK